MTTTKDLGCLYFNKKEKETEAENHYVLELDRSPRSQSDRLLLTYLLPLTGLSRVSLNVLVPPCASLLDRKSDLDLDLDLLTGCDGVYHLHMIDKIHHHVISATLHTAYYRV